MVQYMPPPEAARMHAALEACALVGHMVLIVQYNGGKYPVGVESPRCWVVVERAGSVTRLKVVMHYTRIEAGGDWTDEVVFVASTQAPFGPEGSAPLTADLVAEVQRIGSEGR